MSNNIKFEIKDLSLSRNSSVIFNKINLTIANGSISIIAGKSGSGKTSLLRLLNRLEDPVSGSIYYKEKDLKEYDVLQLRKDISLVQQIPIIIGNSVKDNLLLQSTLTKQPYPSDETLITTLDMCGLSENFINKNAQLLSLGEKQRVCIARSIINKPDVLLLDEPTSSLDFENSLSILHLINDLNKELGITIILVTHKIDEARYLNADYYTLSNGIINKGINY